MIQYDGNKCDKHQQTRCVLCLAAARGTVPQAPIATLPPAVITGGPPPDIEGLGNVRDRLPQTVEEANTDYDNILAEVNAIKAKPPSLELGLPQVNSMRFSTLPTDDSHASQVMRAAAKYAETATTFALCLAETERVKHLIFEAEAKQNIADKALRSAEEELKKLITIGAV